MDWEFCRQCRLGGSEYCDAGISALHVFRHHAWHGCERFDWEKPWCGRGGTCERAFWRGAGHRLGGRAALCGAGAAVLQ